MPDVVHAPPTVFTVSYAVVVAEAPNVSVVSCVGGFVVEYDATFIVYTTLPIVAPDAVVPCNVNNDVVSSYVNLELPDAIFEPFLYTT